MASPSAAAVLAAVLLVLAGSATTLTTTAPTTAAATTGTATTATTGAALYPCNPTPCLRGVRCINATECAPEGNLLACGTDAAGRSLTRFCPPDLHKCADGFCSITAELCVGHGGVEFGPQRCSEPPPSIVCQVRPADGCDMAKAFCQAVTLPACLDLHDFRIFVDDEAGTVVTYSGQFCYLTKLFGPRHATVTTLAPPGECTTLDALQADYDDGTPLVYAAAQWQVRVFRPGEPCPECRMQFYTPPPARCDEFSSRAQCQGATNSSCHWTGIRGFSCVKARLYYFLVSSPLYCFVPPQPRGACNRLPQCFFHEDGGCRSFIIPRANYIVQLKVMYNFELEQLTPAREFRAVTGQLGRTVELNDCNIVAGASGAGLEFAGWGRVALEPTLVLSNVYTAFYAAPASPHELDAAGDPRAGFAGQRFIMGTSQAAARALDASRSAGAPLAFPAISIGTNGVAVYHYVPSRDEFSMVISHATPLEGWHTFVLTYFNEHPQLYVDGVQVGAQGGMAARASDRVMFAPDYVGGLADSPYVGRFDEWILFDYNDYSFWGLPSALDKFGEALGAGFDEFACTLEYSALQQTTTAGAVFQSPRPTLFVSEDGRLVAVDASSPDLVFQLHEEHSNALVINETTGELSGRLPLEGEYPFEVVVTQATSGCVATYVGSITVLPPVRLSVVPGSIRASATVDAPYNYEPQLQPSGGSQAYTFSAAGLPPPVRIIPSSGEFAGSPSRDALSNSSRTEYRVTITARDSHGGEASFSFDLTVHPPLTLLGGSHAATRDAAFHLAAPEAQGGQGLGGANSFKYELSEGALPLGLALDPATGTVSGRPQRDGAFVFTVKIADANDGEVKLQRSLQVNPALRVELLSPPARLELHAFGAVPPGALHFNVSGGTPPFSLTLEPPIPGLRAEPLPGTGSPRLFALAGVPTDAGSHTATTVTARDAVSAFASAALPAVAVVAPSEARGSSGGGRGSAYLILVGCLVSVTALLLLFLAYRLRKERWQRSRPFDFRASKFAVRNFNKAVVIPEELRRSRFDLWNKLGAGSFATVHRAIDTQDSCVVAIKRAHDSSARLLLLEEALVHAQLVHPHIVSAKGVITRNQAAWLVLEYCEKGSLLDLVRCQGLSRRRVYHMATEICSGMVYLQENQIIHCDLACRNVLLTDNFHCKISDLGLSRNIIGDSEYYRGQRTDVVPFRWAAPEAIIDSKFSHAGDVWSFGITVYEMSTNGRRPYGTWHSRRIVRSLMQGVRLPQATLQADLFQLCLRCWAWNAAYRPSFRELHEQLLALHALIPDDAKDEDHALSSASTSDDRTRRRSGDEDGAESYTSAVERLNYLAGHESGSDSEGRVAPALGPDDADGAGWEGTYLGADACSITNLPAVSETPLDDIEGGLAPASTAARPELVYLVAASTETSSV